MQKTQVLKLNTSKDNVESFFNKVKDKISKQGTQMDDYDITMIVKHKNNQLSHIIQQTAVQNQITKIQTLKSIFTQNSPHNIQSISQEAQKIFTNNNNQIIYDQQMHLQKNVLDDKKQIGKKSIKRIEKKLSGMMLQKISEQNEVPNETSGVFEFKWKKESQESQMLNKNNYFPKLYKPQPPIQDQPLQTPIMSDSHSNTKNVQSQHSSTSQKQQINQQQLEKHIQRQQIGIFPNIELSSVVSQRLMSLNSEQFQQMNVDKKRRKKNSILANNINRRRCSIADENLLSPRMKTIVGEEIIHQSTKQINNMLLRDKLSNMSVKSVVMMDDNMDINKDERIDKNQLQKNIRKQTISNTSIKTVENEPYIRLQMLQRPQLLEKDKVRNRTSAFAKKSIFDNENKYLESGEEDKQQGNNNRHIHLVQQQHQQHEQQQQQFIITIPQQPRHMTIPAGTKGLAAHLSENHQQQSSQQSQSQSSQSSSSSNQQQQQQSIYSIQSRLNQCIILIQKNQIFKLEDYLYEFKNKYNYVTNTRIEIKWRLMMAHCKESKKEFQRAAVNYNSVIQLAQENPKSLTIQPAEVYHRLGVCYYENAQYNKGILAFTQALNRYKRGKAPLKYAQCMNNLGNLYLHAQSLNLAEKCFLQSYDLKKTLYDKHNTKLLTPLFNLFECNLLMKNYDQAQRIMFVVQDEIISHIPDKQVNKLLYLGGMHRRKGKMQFLRGNIDSAQENYLKAFQSMSNKYPYSMEFGQLMSCMGILKLEDRKYKQAKEYYDKAIMLMNFYCSKDSKTMHTLKKNLQFSIKMIAEEREGSISRQSFFD